MVTQADNVPSKGTKAKEAFRTISEVAELLGLAQHVLRFWESKFTQIKPVKRGGNRRYYRPDDVRLLAAIQTLLHGEGYTIKGVQTLFKEQGLRFTVDKALQDHPLFQESPESSESFTDRENINGQRRRMVPVAKEIKARPTASATQKMHPKQAAPNKGENKEDKSTGVNKKALKSLLDELKNLRQEL